MPLTVLDIIVIVVVLISATLAMVRGFAREVLSIASWVAAVAAAYFLYKPVLPLLKPYFASGTVATIVAAAVIFFIALIVASYITTRISDFIIDSRIGAFDRGLGFLFGAARGLLLVVVALWFFEFMVNPPPDWVAKARAKPMLDDLGGRLVEVMPTDLESWIQARLHRNDTGVAPPGGDTQAAPDDTSTDDTADPTYKPGTRQNLNQLIQNSNN